MRKFKTSLLTALVLCLFTVQSFASVGIKRNGTSDGTAADLNLVNATGSAYTYDGGTVTIPILADTMFATGTANGGANSMASTDLAVPTSYAYVRKAIAASANPGFSTGTLANGEPGQILTIFITVVGSSGTWTLTPTTATGFTSIKFAAVNDIATFMYVNDTVGWIILSYTGTITVTKSGT